ncbi:MAG: 4Fe-4S dicluster domain-containing protein [Deferrisomatales bacterium]
MKRQWAFFVDAEKCIGCFTCAMACKNQYRLEPGVKWRDVFALRDPVYPHRDRAFYSLACNHCENPRGCVGACPVGAYTKRSEDGVVVHDQDKCIGCGNCVRSCPYGAPRYNPVLKKAEKCSFCHERLDAGRKPACVQGCPTGALELVDLSTFREGGVTQYPPGFLRAPELNPSIRFRAPRQPAIVW